MQKMASEGGELSGRRSVGGADACRVGQGFQCMLKTCRFMQEEEITHGFKYRIESVY